MIGCIIQARVGSKRLPGKVLMDLGGQPVLRRVLDRVALVPSIHKIVVATSTMPEDDLIVSYCEKWGVSCYRGSEDDVLDRFFRSAALYQFHAVVRITGDCPLLDPAVVEKVLREFLRSGADYGSNVFPVRTYPDGLDCEIMTMEALQRAWDEAAEPFDREHVTPYIWRQPEEFKLVTVSSTADMSHLRWTLDTAQDLQNIRDLYARQTDYRLVLP